MKQCKHCGGTEFYASGGCKPCRRVAVAEYQSNNREKISKSRAKHRLENIEKSKADQRRRSAKHYAKNSVQVLADSAKRRQDNPEKERIRCAIYRDKNMEKEKRRGAKYRAANHEKTKARTKKYAKENPEVRRLYKHQRRVKERANCGKLSRGIAAKLFKLQRGKCACCKKQLKEYHLDHRMPLALEGPNTDDNIQLLCPPCNRQKCAKHPIDFMRSKGYLL
ncbi:MAG: HNH endonuclease signature motif containing protein [Gallionella sp.]